MKRSISLVLLLCMLLSAAACGNTPTESGSDTSAVAQTTEPAPETLYEDKLPPVDLEGATFTIYMEQTGTETYHDFYNIYEETGSVVNDAAYQRNRAVEERLNVDILYTEGISWEDANTFNNSVQAGAMAYDLISAPGNVVTQCIVAGTTLDLNDCPEIDLTQPYYMKYINDEMNFIDKQFTAAGYFDMATVHRTAAVFFSTKLAEDNSIGNLYEMVKNNEWTFDTMLSLASTSYGDVNGDGFMTEEDQYGLCGGFNMNGLLITSTGYRFTTKQEDGSRIATGVTELLVDFNQMLFDTYASEFYFNCYPKGGKNNFNMANINFTKDQYLFYLNDVGTCRLFSEEMEGYGILPIPKYTDTQTDYTSYCRPFQTSIPRDAKSAEASAIGLEALNMYSYSILLPAYYDIALSSRYAASPEASEVLDIIFSNVCCDFVQQWYSVIGSSINPPLHNTVGVEENYVSYFEGVENTFNGRLAKIYEASAKANE